MDYLRSLVTSVSLAFTRNYRVTLLLFVATIAMGTFAYTTLLPRNGFPAVQFPIGIVQGTYFVENPNQVDSKLTTPIENVVAKMPEVKKIQSVSNDNFSQIFIEFNNTVTSEQGMKLVKNEVDSNLELPEGAKVEYNPIYASSVDGFHDMLFAISGEQSTEQMQKDAAKIVEKIQNKPEVESAKVLEQIVTEIDPKTGKEFKYQDDFSRYATKENGNLVFRKGVAIGVKQNADVSSVELSESVRDEVKKLQDQGELKGYEISYAGDLAEDIDLQIGSLQENALGGIIAVIIVLFLIVSWRASIITAIFIPTVVAASLVTLYLIGYSLNVITLFGLILVLGLLVDDGIVVVESIDYYKKKGYKGIEAVKEGVYHISIADIAGTLSTALVFVPLAAISGILGEFIRPIPVTVIITLLLSLTIALTFLPLLSSVILKDGKLVPYNKRKTLDKIVNGFEYLVFAASKTVTRFINYYLGSKLLTFGVLMLSIVLIGAGLFASSKLKFSIFPNPKDSNDVIVNITYPENTSLEQAEKIADFVDNTIKKEIGENVNNVDYFQADTAGAMIDVALVDFKDRDTKAPELVEKLNSKFENYTDAKVKAGAVSVGPPLDEFQYSMQVYADDTKTLTAASKSIESFIKVQKLKNSDVKILDAKTDDLVNIAKNDGRRLVTVRAKLSESVTTGDLVELRDKIKAEYTNEKLKEFNLTEEDLGFDLGQESENLNSFNSSIFALLIALILIYVLLVIQFNSFMQPLLILIAIPFTAIGVFPGLLLTDNPISFFVMIGLTGLIGIVVNNTIMLVDYANIARKEGKTIRASIVQSVSRRFRPLLATSTLSVAGLLPLALSDPFWESLALTIIFGIIASSTMVILTFPAYYAVVEKLRKYKNTGFKKLFKYLDWDLAKAVA